MRFLGAFSALFVATATEVSAQGDLDWTAGVGMTPCNQLAQVPDDELTAWVQGYWTGANLYLGSGDLCVERSSIVGLDANAIRTVIEVHCAPIQNSEIMFAAFNALKGLPKIEGSRAAVCGGTP